MILRELDFSRSRPMPRIGVGVLVVGVIAFAVALAHRQQVEDAHAKVELRVRAEEAARDAQRRASAPPAKPVAAQVRLQAAQVELARPWLPALGAVEAATADPVFLLSMSFERNSGLLRLEGEAPSFEKALDYVGKLDAAPLSSTVLLSHERVTHPDNGRTVVRFSATSQWGGR
jgi:hypothetical protein